MGALTPCGTQEDTSEHAALASDRWQDVVFYHADGQAVMRRLREKPVSVAETTFTYWIPCDFENGQWYTLQNPQEADGDADAGVGGGRAEATKERVEHVLSHVSWLLIRGVFQAVRVGDAFADPDAVPSGGGAVGAVGVVRTALRGAALTRVGTSDLQLLDVRPTQGPVTGNTVASLIGTGLLTLEASPSALHSSSYSPVCVWKCSATESPVTTSLTIVNDTAAHCKSPWRAAPAECAMGVGALMDQAPVLIASLAQPFFFYVPPSLTEIRPTQAQASGGTFVTIFGSGLSAREDARCRLQLSCNRASVAVWGLVAPAPGSDSHATAGSGLPYVTCSLPQAPCSGAGVVSYSPNGQDFVHLGCPTLPRRTAPTSPHVAGLRSDHDQCVLEILSPVNAPGQAPGSHVPTPSTGMGGGGVSAVGVVGVAWGVLAWVGVGAAVTKGAERRRLVRQWNGSAAPYSVAEAYLVWLLFGLLGAHRCAAASCSRCLSLHAVPPSGVPPSASALQPPHLCFPVSPHPRPSPFLPSNHDGNASRRGTH